MKKEILLGKLLIEKGFKISVAESCTGGLISHTITNVPGSSRYYDRGFIVYSNEAKITLLGVDPSVIKKFGAVSSNTAISLSKGVIERSVSDISLAVTGVCGPDGGTKDKPVGLVYIAFCHLGHVLCREFVFSGDREDIKLKTTDAAIRLVCDYLKKHLSDAS